MAKKEKIMITREKSQKGELQLHLVIDGKTWQEAVEKSYEKNKGKYSIQGFRKGKAPRKVIEKNYGDTVFYDDAFESLVTEEYGKFLDENPDVEPSDYPRTVLNSMTDDGLDVTLKVTLMPEVKLGKLEFNIKKAKASVTEKEIEGELKKFVESQARFEESKDPAEMGDFVVMDFAGRVKGELFEGGTAKDYRLELGSHSFIEGFEEGLVGVKAGEKRTVKVTFPAAYPAENLAGQDAEFECDVKKVEKKKLPQLNDKLVSFATEFANLEEYKASIKAKLLSQKEEANERKLENDLIEQATKDASVDIPKSMIEHEKEHNIADFENRLRYQNIKLKDYLNYIGKSEEEYNKEQLAEAEIGLKTRLVLQKIIKDNNLQITHEEFHEKLHQIADKQNKTCHEVEEGLSDYEISYIQNDLLMNKLIAFLKSKNK